jgi:hypothetical protein
MPNHNLDEHFGFLDPRSILRTATPKNERQRFFIVLFLTPYFCERDYFNELTDTVPLGSWRACCHVFFQIGREVEWSFRLAVF